MMLGALVLFAGGCASVGRPRNDPGARLMGGRLRPTVTAGEMGATARQTIQGAVIGGSGGASIASEMDTQAETLAGRLRFARVWRVGEGIAVVVESELLFDAESSALLADVDNGLGGLAASLQSEPRTHILVLAHTDSFAADSYNSTMSSRRGQAVADYLRAQGIAAARIQTHGCAAREPIASNETARGRLDNRRIEVAITADDDWRRLARLP
jgi:outer membrane protein OmpA-like peptidoglycan-associated protein